ncbi:MAG TPA: 5-methyltetrahydropteroyltriglutamate--homocysteine S-methyltransferase [Ktedonobacteraceae bacterium]|nr:5-methyltetrahydropteroyltriglutamate--homocysteine S-methyltransferase [Ktedonobacteraceae bacterium]
MVRTTTLGYPRVGRRRELKQACEAYWSGKIGEEELSQMGAALRRVHWQVQRDAGIDLIPVNDFSFYDQVLDALALLGAVPERYHWEGGAVDLATYFAMARGVRRAGLDAPAMEMTKWFDTNYHYIVPEWSRGQRFQLASSKPFDEFAEARAQGIPVKPVLVGPFSLVLLGKAQQADMDLLDETLSGVVAVYGEIIARLAAMGADWIQLDEPCLVQDRTPAELAVLRQTYEALAQRKGGAKLIISTMFGNVGESYETLCTLPVDGIGLDFVRGPENCELVQRYGLPSDKILVAGVVDGRNIWRADLPATLDLLEDVATLVPRERLVVAPSCSLLHVPYDAASEVEIAPEVSHWLAFAEQKLGEVVVLGRALHEGRASVAGALAESATGTQSRATSPLVHNAAVQAKLSGQEAVQRSPYAERRLLQAQHLGLPALPTTTIGSFPQTAEVRQARRRFETGQITPQEYEHFIERSIADLIARQESLGIDVLVHGEFERNDMVQYFGEQLSGFAFTHHGWVQSYGSRCVRPPIIYGDVARPAPMTVRWSAYAQSLTAKPVKAMLTGPVTMLNWSFVRDDQPRETTCRQIALALSDEVTDLERAGLRVIQVDEPALREGLPLRKSRWNAYLNWAVACFRLATSGAESATQIHTHMCYSAFNDIIDAIAALDADVISLENSRSGGELLEVFRQTSYDKEIGPGVYDIHSPRVPSVDEIEAMLRATLQVLPAASVWVNPDCGLKTRTWEEVVPALEHMITATRKVRASLASEASVI